MLVTNPTVTGFGRIPVVIVVVIVIVIVIVVVVVVVIIIVVVVVIVVVGPSSLFFHREFCNDTATRKSRVYQNIYEAN
jgi:uncharacterized membrane protein